MSEDFDIRSIQAKWLLGLILSDDLPGIAIQALVAGFDSKSLVKLSVQHQGEPSESKRLFERALEELGLQNMSKTEALEEYAKAVSSFIHKSTMTPIEGARLIWDATLKAGVTEYHGLDGFVYAASEYESRPEDREFFEKAIIKEAGRWI